MNKSTYCVYMHKNKINGKIYVGSTKYGDDPVLRWCKNGEGYKGNNNFWYDIQKYGWNNFEHYIIQNNLSSEEANKLEKLTIIEFNATDPNYGYNRNIVGNLLNEQSIQKISESLKQLYANGYVNPMQGKYHSKETKQKMSEICKDKYCGKNNPMYGKHHSEETKRKISIAKSKSSKNKVWVTDGNKALLIDKKDLDVYLNNGYSRGRK